jgi:RNA polymerase sigma-70 factor (ECF subfamily)
VGERGVATTRAGSSESRLVQGLKAGDEGVFGEIVDRFTPSMLRVARAYGLTAAAAEDAVQEAWLKVLRSLDRFEGRSSFRTWLFVILGNCARRRGATERRTVSLEPDAAEPAVAESRFFGADHPRWAGMWTTLVDPWERIPEERLLAEETRERFRAAIDALPERYTVVFVLRDVEGWPSEDVCAVLGLTPENQRVLLHRARTRIRAALEQYLEGER